LHIFKSIFHGFLGHINPFPNNNIPYNTANVTYKNILIKNNVWKEISSETGKSGEHSSHQYVNIKSIIDKFKLNSRAHLI